MSIKNKLREYERYYMSRKIKRRRRRLTAK